MPHVSFVVLGALVLVAGFVLSTWWAVPLLASATALGCWLSVFVFTQMNPGPGSGEALAFFVILGVLPGLAFLLIGTAIGSQRGISSVPLGRTQVQVFAGVPASQWIPAISLVLGGGFLAGALSILLALGGGVNIGTITFFAGLVLLATSCLAASIRLHSWLGLIVASVVYIAVAVLSEMLFWGVTHVSATILTFVSYIMVPAVVFSAIGTIIGQRRQRGIGWSQRTLAGVLASPWVPAIGLAVVSGYFAGLLGFGGLGDFVLPNGLVLLSPMLISLACLLSSWLLRSWWGLVAVPAVYVACAALTNGYLMTGQPGLDFGLFSIFIVLPAVAMSAIGTAIGMYTTSRGGPHPHYAQPATTA